MLSTESTKKKRRRRSQKRYLRWRGENERESSNQNCCQGSRNRADRGRKGLPSRSRHDRRDAGGASFWFCQHQNESGSGSVWRKTVATERDRPRKGWLQIVPYLARRWRGFWTEAAGLFQEDLKIRAASGVSKGIERADQGRRRFDDR